MTKKNYRVRNWKEYNQSLVNRGSITLWFDEPSIESWHNCERNGQRGRPEEYSDTAILCGLTLRAVFKLTYRATEGFLSSLINLLGLQIRCPDYSLLCKRQKTLPLPKLRKDASSEPLHIVVDSTGLKVYGEGEWKVRQHGHSKRRIWRKLHVAINSDTQRIESFVLTDLGTQDCEAFPELVEKIDSAIDSIAADGAYDRFSCYEEAEKKSFTLIAPPQHNANTSEERTRNKKKASTAAVRARDEVIKEVRELGRKEWKIKSQYHQRSLAETGIFRVKTLMGNKLTARTFERQCNEVALWCHLINKITETGMPVSVAV